VDSILVSVSAALAPIPFFVWLTGSGLAHNFRFPFPFCGSPSSLIRSKHAYSHIIPSTVSACYTLVAPSLIVRYGASLPGVYCHSQQLNAQYKLLLLGGDINGCPTSSSKLPMTVTRSSILYTCTCTSSVASARLTPYTAHHRDAAGPIRFFHPHQQPRPPSSTRTRPSPTGPTSSFSGAIFLIVAATFVILGV
jgi:hypothetical protein